MFKIAGLIFGVLLLVFGIYYTVNEKDQEAKKIYTITSVIGAVVAAVCIFLLL